MAALVQRCEAKDLVRAFAVFIGEDRDLTIMRQIYVADGDLVALGLLIEGDDGCGNLCGGFLARRLIGHRDCWGDRES